MGTTMPCAPPPPGGKDSPVAIRVGSATRRCRSAGRSTASTAGPKQDLSHAKAAV
ncbi:hypothetical protein DPMN_114468 [Dreissena polymorpha]|uniref:Uncharacterized protein n=1 Tax=Dreissena polymorpha TaxID=45954 RepID=A0A9D4KK78_DREPO|nr:hypothetical protein DPMN_114468 [Dreissena polymorpha]